MMQFRKRAMYFIMAPLSRYRNRINQANKKLINDNFKGSKKIQEFFKNTPLSLMLDGTNCTDYPNCVEVQSPVQECMGCHSKNFDTFNVKIFSAYRRFSKEFHNFSTSGS